MSPHRPRSERDPDFAGSRPRGLDDCPHRPSWIVVRIGDRLRFHYCPECVQGQWWSPDSGPIDRSQTGLDRR